MLDMTETLVLDRNKNIGSCYVIPKKWEKPIRNVIEAQNRWVKCNDQSFPDLMPCLGNKGVYYYPEKTFVAFNGNRFGLAGPDELNKAGFDLKVVFKDQFVFDYSRPQAVKTQIGDVKVCLDWGAKNIFDDPDIKRWFIQLAQLLKKVGYVQIDVSPSYHSHNPNDVLYNCVAINFVRTEEKISSRFFQQFRIKPVDNNFSGLEQDLINAWRDTLDAKIAKTEGTVNEYTKKLKKLQRLRAKA